MFESAIACVLNPFPCREPTLHQVTREVGIIQEQESPQRGAKMSRLRLEKLSPHTNAAADSENVRAFEEQQLLRSPLLSPAARKTAHYLSYSFQNNRRPRIEETPCHLNERTHYHLSSDYC